MLVTAAAATTGFAPAVRIGPANPEQAKYERMWGEVADYRAIAPGEHWAMTFLAQAKPPADSDVIDFGCGTGRGALMLALLGRMKVTLVDFAANCLDPEVAGALDTQANRLKFLQHDLTRLLPVNAAYGYCCDVMEHLPPEQVMPVLINVLSSANHCFFAISTVEDNMGSRIGEHLHLTVRPAAWWAEQLTKAGAVIHWREELEDCVAFYCSSWRDAAEVIKSQKINTDEAIVEAQTAHNISAGWQQAEPHDRQDREVVLLCGGPSMNDHVDQIRELRQEGATIVTVNGAYHWALDRGLEPGAQIVLDARQFNARFAHPVTPYTRYLIASQVHPDTLAGLPHERTYLWHSGVSDKVERLVREHYGEFWPVPGGSTVVLRALPLLRMLGFHRIHLFGFDSCVRGKTHHAYAQAENDNELTLPVICGGKHFDCTPWQLSQASEFRGLVGLLGDEMELAVYGDGLIAAMIAAGYEFAQKEQ